MSSNNAVQTKIRSKFQFVRKYRCYGVNKAPDYLILEDLNLDGYRNVNKTLGLNQQKIKLVLSQLAKWHAATAVLNVTV